MEGFVYCQMADTAIPGHLCDREQNDTECRGCKAPTRRCAHCNEARGIAEPREGVCAPCVAKNGDGQEDKPPVSLSKRLEEQVRSLRTFARGPMPRSAIPEEPYVLPTRVIDDVDNLFALLGEHSTALPNGTRVVKAPSTVLLIRAGLSGEESQRLLERFVGEHRIAFNGSTDGIRIIGGDEPISAYKETRQSPRRYSFPMPVVPRPASVPRPRHAQGVQWRQYRVDSREVYEELLRQSRRLGAEQVVSGVVPVVQLKFRMMEVPTLQLLLDLEREGRILRRDGWRSIVIVPEKKPEDVAPPLLEPKKEDPVARRERLTRQLELARAKREFAQLFDCYGVKVKRQYERLRVIEETIARGTREIRSRSKDKPVREVSLRPSEIAAFLWERNEIRAWMTDHSADPVYQECMRILPAFAQQQRWSLPVFLELVRQGYLFEDDLRVAGFMA